MSEMVPTAAWLVKQWCSHLRSAMALSTGISPAITELLTDRNDLRSMGPGSWTRQPFPPGSDADLSVYVPTGTSKQILSMISTATGVEEAETLRHTWLEMLHQTHSALAQNMAERLPGKVAAGSPEELIAPGPGGTAYMIQITADATETLRIGLLISAGLLDLLSPGTTPAQPATQAPEARQPKVAEMDLVLDVELPLTISFGRSYLQLREVVKLSAGSIVELDRLINDPVDILVNKCVIARGEVVVIEGNYGVRVTEVIDRSDRLALRGNGNISARQDLRQRETA